MNILLSGCNGGMGKAISNLVSGMNDVSIAAGFDSKPSNDHPFPVFTDLSKMTEDIDVVIDFSHFSAFDAIVDYSLKNKTPLVMATTGLTDDDEQSLINISGQIPVFRTANMSIGINVMLGLVSQAEKLLKGFDIEIIEKHHNKKLDSPSGTALMLANELNNSSEKRYDFIYGREGKSTKRQENEIGIHAVRGGTIAGEHTVIYAGEDEIVEIKHSAASKAVFAKGAIEAAKFIYKKENGLYDMKKMLGL
ncbi:4-hydroxy-tetrahydrodipicolinate reductase [Alkalibacter mobilis]|uniref:4-hydroxy-tetrahydrodipicolinate reductase n=1 Tax=Alkalibacter mobilis TaxID=2787712 RepID=UPI00189CDAA3|nr:4-hydroxy-tetrahydrodipicolinate reductase [Alkalibacter mobilis]MBF7097732.1 4-hydroxy-tetrahydrodipicolinate reductase [Alkalibacter mobilis]